MLLNRVRVIFLLCRCRTGSTTLTKSISKHEHAIAYPEILNGIQAHSYQAYLLTLLAQDGEARSAFLSKGPLFAFNLYIIHLVEKALAAKPDLKLMVLECKIETMYVMSSQWSHPGMEFRNLDFLRRAVEISDAVLMLRRRNMLDRYCSNIVAQATSVFHADQGSQSDAAQERNFTKREANIRRILREFQQELDFDTRLFAHLQDMKADASLLEYEKIYQEGQFTPEFLDDFFSVSKGIRLAQPAMAKVRGLSPADIFSNFDSLKKAMANLPALSMMLDGSPQ